MSGAPTLLRLKILFKAHTLHDGIHLAFRGARLEHDGDAIGDAAFGPVVVAEG
jgi:hypothetical protein